MIFQLLCSKVLRRGEDEMGAMGLYGEQQMDRFRHCSGRRGCRSLDTELVREATD